MSLLIFYTPRSKGTLESVYNFIHDKFGSRSADRFVLKAERIIALIAEHPLMFKASTIDDNVRIALISK
jgi:plasmid stabilization system protein ParE